MHGTARDCQKRKARVTSPGPWVLSNSSCLLGRYSRDGLLIRHLGLSLLLRFPPLFYIAVKAGPHGPKNSRTRHKHRACGNTSGEEKLLCKRLCA